MPMGSAAWIICSKKPYRTLEDYALTLAGIPPLPTSSFKTRTENDELNRRYLSCLKTLQYSVALGDLRAAKAGLSWVCRYEDFQEWAQKTGYMEAPAIEIVSQPRDNQLRTRKINLVRAIESAACKLHSKLGKKPSMDELWNYFETDHDETGFIEDYTDTHLTWRNTKGKLSDVTKRTVANHLSRIKI